MTGTVTGYLPGARAVEIVLDEDHPAPVVGERVEARATAPGPGAAELHARDLAGTVRPLRVPVDPPAPAPDRAEIARKLDYLHSLLAAYKAIEIRRGKTCGHEPNVWSIARFIADTIDELRALLTKEPTNG